MGHAGIVQPLPQGFAVVDDDGVVREGAGSIGTLLHALDVRFAHLLVVLLSGGVGILVETHVASAVYLFAYG